MNESVNQSINQSIMEIVSQLMKGLKLTKDAPARLIACLID